MRLGARARHAAAAALVGVALPGCDEPVSSTRPDSAVASVRFVYAGPTARRSDLPPSALDCVNGVGLTHIHPSWRAFAATPLRPLPPDRYDILFDDVPVGTRLTFRINDQNSCDENPTGAVTRNVLVNDVRLMQNATTPGNGDGRGTRSWLRATARSASDGAGGLRPPRPSVTISLRPRACSQPTRFLSSSMAEHPAVNRRVAGSSPA